MIFSSLLLRKYRSTSQIQLMIRDLNGYVRTRDHLAVQGAPQTSNCHHSMVGLASRNPGLQLSLPGNEEDSKYASGLQERIERQVANDAQYLPRSTNMGLPNHISTGVKYNFEENSDEEGNPKSKCTIDPPATASFKRSIPCFFVAHIPISLPWYQEVLGFRVKGKPDASRAELFRGHPRVSRSQEGVSLYLRKRPEEDGPTPKGSLWIEVDDIDGLHREISYKMNKFAQDITDYFPPIHFGSAKIVSKPRNTPWGQREMTTVDDAGNSIIFFQVLAR
ncbi:unnamed protein product [Sympodiomycopsis kandeliae]